MKKIIQALLLSLCALLFPCTGSAAPQEHSTATTKQTAVSDPSQATAQSLTPATDNAAAKTAATKADKAKQKLTPEQRNKKIKEADSYGLGITIMSMAIVICALVVLSLLFLTFGKISQKMHSNKRLKDYGIAHDEEDHEASSGEACAAIAAALYQYFNDRHDVEDTVLTIRKLKRAYSPWSSKLYELRQTPQRNPWSK